jgi:sulfite reductase alpha subunit-like flavoprotein
MMRGVQYTVLGLGDQNYTAFMAVPRLFHKRMDDLGALCFYPRGEADEVRAFAVASAPCGLPRPLPLLSTTRTHTQPKATQRTDAVLSALPAAVHVEVPSGESILNGSLLLHPAWVE